MFPTEGKGQLRQKQKSRDEPMVLILGKQKQLTSKTIFNSTLHSFKLYSNLMGLIGMSVVWQGNFWILRQGKHMTTGQCNVTGTRPGPRWMIWMSVSGFNVSTHPRSRRLG